MAQPGQHKPQSPSLQRQAPLGIDSTIREMAEAAARRAGLPLDDWLKTVTSKQLSEELVNALAVLPGIPFVTIAALIARSGLTKDLLSRAEPAPVREESERLRDIANLLGGRKVVGKYPADPLAAHEMLERGLPNTAVKHLVDGMTTLSQKSIEGALGMSERTRQRREKHPTELLSPDQAGRTWKFAEVLTRAISVFGSRAAAEQWLAQPATGLEQRRPIDLLTTPAGVELVEDFLGRIEYGVYT